MSLGEFFQPHTLVTSDATDAATLLLVHLCLLSLASVAVAIICWFHKSKDVYLIDFASYLPPGHLRFPLATIMEHLEICEIFDKESIDFQYKVMIKSGIGEETSAPEGMCRLPPDTSMRSTKAETEMVTFTAVQDLLSKLNISPKSIDILVSSCSVYCPTPSITAMVVNKFGFRSNIKSFNLSGMGCSASLIAVSLARDLLKVNKNSLALIVSMEAVTPNGYIGKSKSMLLTNTLFRMGGAAILLSNRNQDKLTSKYKLQHLVKIHMGSQDMSYNSVYQDTDKAGQIGVSLSKTLLTVAGNALRRNISEFGPLVLPYSEQIKYAISVIRQRVQAKEKRGEAYVPDFRKAFEHFCIHAGGRAVIDSVEENLRLTKEDTEASRMTLYRFGNTSSSSIWYELSYLEAKQKVKKGDRIWQIAFGSGFKCNSAVWKCISDIDSLQKNAWSDRIHLYPVDC